MNIEGPLMKEEKYEVIGRADLALLESSPFAIAAYTFKDGCIITLLVSDGLLALQAPGMSREELIFQFNHDMYRNVLAEDTPLITAKARDFALNGGKYDAIYHEALYGKDSYAVIHAYGYHLMLEDGTRIALVQYDDVTGAVDNGVKSQQSFASSIQNMLDASEVGSLIVAVDTHEVLFANRAFKKMLGITRNIDSAMPIEEFLHPEIKNYEFPFEYYLSNNGGLLVGADSSKEAFIRIYKSSFEEREVYVINASSYDERFYDALTRLPNYSYFKTRSVEMDAKYRANGTPCIVYFGLEGLSVYNNNFGFSAGDKLMKDVADSLRELFPHDLLCRLSQARFLVMCDLLTAEERALKAIERLACVKLGGSLHSYAGLYKVEEEMKNISIAADRAKLAYYRAKEANTPTFFYIPELSKSYELTDFLVANLDKSLARGDIKVFYQPIVHTLFGTLTSFEALTRWYDADEGVISPSVFVPALERTRLIHRLDIYVVNKVAEDIRARLDAGLPVVPVSFNLSRADFQNCDIFDEVEKALQLHNVPRDLVRVEITESLLAGEDSLRLSVKRFRDAGYQVWMDDFGSGYSFLNILKDCEFDELKLDMAFLSSLNQKAKKIVCATVKMAKDIGVSTIAEGVETQEQLDFLRSIGVEKIQGFYFGRPLPLEQALANLEKNDIRFETPKEASYFDKVGEANLLSEKAVALAEVSERGISCLAYNDRFGEGLKALGRRKPMFNVPVIDDEYELYGKIEKACRRASFNKAASHMNFTENGILCLLEVEEVAAVPSRSAYRFTLTNVSGSFSERELMGVDRTLNAMYSLYQLIAKVNVSDRTFQTVYSELELSYKDSEVLKPFFMETIDSMVHPDDMARWKEFSNLANWPSLTGSNSHRSDKTYFRFLGKDSKYQWMALLLIRNGDDDDYILSAYRVEDPEDIDYLSSRFATSKRYSMAESDALTGLLNRFGLDRYAKEYFREDQNDPAVILTIDLDNLKFINDLCGHAIGDSAIKTLTENLHAYFGDNSLICRTGGDEFLVLLKNRDLEMALPLINAFVKAKKTYYYQGMAHNFTASIGIATYPDQSRDFNQLLANADAAAYYVKMHEKGQAKVYEPSMGRMSRSQLAFNLQDIAGGMPGAILVYKATGEEEILFANNELVKMMDCDDLEDFLDFTSHSFRHFVYHDDIDRVEKDIWRQIHREKGEMLDYIDYRIKTKAGKIKYIKDAGRLVNSPFYGEIFYVYLYEQEKSETIAEG